VRIDGAVPTINLGSVAGCYKTLDLALADVRAKTTVSDNCNGKLEPKFEHSGKSCDIVVKISATDSCGNSASREVKVKVDTGVPSLKAPAEIELVADDKVQSTVPDLLKSLEASDDCSGLVLSQEPKAGTIVEFKTPSSVKVTATDACGNSTTAEVLLKPATAPSGVTLLIEKTEKGAKISWKLDDKEYQLEFSEAAGPKSEWSKVGEPVTVEDGYAVVIVPFDHAGFAFRLVEKE
jgi:hypothetical protein